MHLIKAINFFSKALPEIYKKEQLPVISVMPDRQLY